MRFVARRATLAEGRLMQVRLLHLLRLFSMASQTCINWIRLQEAWCAASVRIVTGNAFALRAWMLHLRLLNLLCLLAVTGNANGLGIGLGQHNLAVLGGCVTGVAASAHEGRMREGLHQLGL